MKKEEFEICPIVMAALILSNNGKGYEKYIKEKVGTSWWWDKLIRQRLPHLFE